MTIGKMNIEFSEQYDQESDTYYVTFNTGEPSYSGETEDDILLLEIGIFTGKPTGFRILNFKKSKVQVVGIESTLKTLKKEMKTFSKNIPPAIHPKEAELEQALEKVFA